MRKTIVTVFFCVAGVAAAAQAAAQDVPADSGAAVIPSSHTVTRGDTLWGLADKYYKNPYRWRTIWEANRTAVKNPDRIYPAQVFTLPGMPAAAPAAEAPAAPSSPAPLPAAGPAAGSVAADTGTVTAAPVETQPEAAPRQEAPLPPVEAAAPAPSSLPAVQQGGSARFKGNALIAAGDWEIDGKIIGDTEKKLMISEGDTVYVDIGGDRARPGCRYGIYRKKGKIRIPSSQGETTGYELQRVGRLEITTETGEHTSTAKVISSADPIEVGDVIKAE